MNVRLYDNTVFNGRQIEAQLLLKDNGLASVCLNKAHSSYFATGEETPALSASGGSRIEPRLRRHGRDTKLALDRLYAGSRAGSSSGES